MDSIIPVRKHQKVLEGSDNIDRISNLPNELICRILSLLPTKYAIRSGILSNRWKNIWVSLPVLDFDMNLWRNYSGDRDKFDTYQKDQWMKFMDFFDRLLGIRMNVRTEKFRFSCCDSLDFLTLYRWFKRVMMMCTNLDELDLESSTIRNPIELPPNIFRYKTLVVLKLSGKFILYLPSVALSSLKFLSLKHVVSGDVESIQDLLCGCPVLEDLNIEREEDDKVWNYVISVPSLKRLTLTFFGILKEDDDEDEGFYNSDEYDDDDESGDSDNPKPKHTLSLHTPNLEYLKFVGQMPQLISITEMPFLSKADYGMSQYGEKVEEYEIGPYELLEATPNVRHLSLCGGTQRVLHSFRIGRNESLFKQLIHLELGFDTWNGPKLLPYFLILSPNLRSISLPEGISRLGEHNFTIEYKWIPPNNVPGCLLASLKKFEVHKVCGENVEEMNLLKYFLKNAMVLEKMTVFFHYFPCHDFGVDCYSSKEEELMNYPKGSSSADLSISTCK